MLRLNIVAVTDLTLLGLVHHLRQLHDAYAAAVYMDRPLGDRHQRPVGDDPVNLGHPLHDADAYLRRLGVAAYGLVVLSPEQYLVPQGEQRPQVGSLLRMLPRQRLQDVLDVPVGRADVDV